MHKKLLLRLVLFIPVMFFVHSIDALELYMYDVTGRLTKVTYNDGSSISYAYDANGNRLSSAPTAVVNQAPVANDDAAATVSDTAVDIDILANDSDADGTLDASSVVIVSLASNASASVNATTGIITYTPGTGFSGADSLTYTVNDNDGATSNIATVSITIGTVNQAPVATDDSVTTPFEVVVDIDVLGNDTDADGSLDATTVAIGIAAQNGTATVAVNGQVTYTPAAGFSGADSFTYTVMDDQGAISNIASVSITVEAEPPNQAPVANNDSITTEFDSAVVISVLGNDTDADGTLDATTVAIGTAAQNGTTTVAANGQVTYTPNTGFSGADSFTYTVLDDDGDQSNPATVSITVNAMPVPPPPVPVPAPRSIGGGGGAMGVGVLLLLLSGLGRRYFSNRKFE